MKISSIIPYGFYTGGSVSQTGNYLLSSPLRMNAPQMSASLQNDTISFKKADPGLYVHDMRELPDLPCACCGKKMLKNSTVNQFLNKKIYFPARVSLQRIKNECNFNESKASVEMQAAYKYLKEYAQQYPKLSMDEVLTKKAVINHRDSLSEKEDEAFDTLRDMTRLVAHNSKYMIDEISKLNPDFHKTEKRVFKELQRLAQEYPDETFYDILNKPEIHKHYLENLETKQLVVLEEVEKAAQNAPYELRGKIYEATNKARKIFKEEDKDIHHKRQRVIAFYNDLFKQYPSFDSKNIMRIVNHLPDSKTDMDAFMIKGAQKSSNAIVLILLKRNVSTFEHVKPHKRKGDKGASNISNYIALCGKCNEERERTHYDIFVQSHPEMIKNTQLQLDRIICFINKGILAKHDNYPSDIAKALDTESKSLIKVDISKLDLEQAKVNRKLRHERSVTLQKAQKSPLIFKFGKGFFQKKTTKHKLQNQ